MKQLNVKPQKKMNKGQAGFTMLEMMIVMAVIAALIGIGVSLYDKQVTKAKITDASAFVERGFLIAITGCQMKYRSYTKSGDECSHASGVLTSKLAVEGLDVLTPWDTNWSSTVTSGGAVVITYPLGTGNDDAAGDLAVTLDNSKLKHVVSASATGSTVTVNVKAP